MEFLAMLTAQLMAGSHPDVVHAAHVPRLMDLAEAIIKEATKRTTNVAPLPSGPVPAPAPGSASASMDKLFGR